jgi:hypothetical protein
MDNSVPKLRDFLSGFNLNQQERWINGPYRTELAFIESNTIRLDETIAFLCIFNELDRVYNFRSLLKKIMIVPPSHFNRSDSRVMVLVLSHTLKTELLFKMVPGTTKISCAIYKPHKIKLNAPRIGHQAALDTCVVNIVSEGMDMPHIEKFVEQIKQH